MKVSVIRELCIGCGLCESSCPEVFEMRENIAAVKEGAVIVPDVLRTAARECPVEAIVVEE